MNKKDREFVNQIIVGFELEYQKMRRESSIVETPIVRTAFYESCLMIVRDGPRFKNVIVQDELTRYYTEMTRLEKIQVVKFMRDATARN